MTPSDASATPAFPDSTAPTAAADLATAIVAAANVAAPTPGAHAVARYLEALQVEVRSVRLPTGVVGRTVYENTHVIEIAEDAPPARKLFTVAHEVGHILLEEASCERSLAPTLPTTYTDVERLCDRIAAEILMPPTWVGAVGYRAVLSASVAEVAFRIGVSASAFVVRLSELGFPAVFLRAHRDPGGRWQLTYPPAGRLHMTNAWRIDLNTLDGAPRRTRYTQPAQRREWRIGEDVCGEVLRGSRTATLWFAGIAPAEAGDRSVP